MRVIRIRLFRKSVSLFMLLMAAILFIGVTSASAKFIQFVPLDGSYLPGSGDGQLDSPNGIAVDSSGNIYVADSQNHRIQKFDSNGNLLAKWGSEGSGDGQFNLPGSIAVDSDGNIYVADSFNRRIQKFHPNCNLLAKWGSGTADKFSVAFDVKVNNGKVYIVDAISPMIQRFDSDGNFELKWACPFNYGYGMAVDGVNNVIYIADSGDDQIQRFDLNNGQCLSPWGSTGSEPGQFNSPMGIAVDSGGKVYVADTYNNRIQIFDSNGVFLANSEFIYRPSDIVVGNGRVYITQHSYCRVLVSAPTLKDTSTVKGAIVSSLGQPGAVIGASTAGSVTITAAQAADTTETAPYATLFDKDDVNAAVKVVKYAANDDTSGFDTDAAYSGTAIANNDFFIIRVTSGDIFPGVSYYKIAVKVNPPDRPTIKSAKAGDAHVNIGWYPVPDATAYKVYMSTTAGSYDSELATVGGSVYNYHAEGLVNGTTYYFIVKANNSGGDSEASNEVSATPFYSYKISLAADPPSGGFVSGGGLYKEGDSVTVTASVYDGYRFVNWTENNAQVSANYAYTFTMGSSDINLVAHFSQNHHSSGGKDNNSTTSLQAVSSTTGSATVNPAAGGTVGLGTDVLLKIPANALQGSDGAQVQVQKVDTAPAAPAGFMIMGTVYEFTVNNQEHYSFNRPVTLTFTFDPSKLEPGQIPAIYYYDETEGQWVNIGGTVSGNTITVNVDHLTKYAVMVEQKASQVQKPALVLTDIEGHWAKANIIELVRMGAVSGYLNGTFKPDNTITRAEFVTVLVKAFKLEQKRGHLFKDTSGHWAIEFINTAAANGIVSGYDTDIFGPDELITREQMAVMIVKAAKLAGTSGETAFADNADISPWAQSSILSAVRAGIIEGYPNNTFKPQRSVTRAEAMTAILNSIGSTK